MPDQPLTAQDLRDAFQMRARMTRRGSSYEDVAREIGSVVLAAGIVWAIIGAPVVPAVQEFLPDASDEMTADRALTSAVVALGFVIGISYIVGEVVAPAYPSSILTCRCGRSCACCASRPHRRPHVPGRQRAVSDIAAFCEEFRRAGDESGGGVAYIGAGSLEGVERSSNWTAFEDYEGVAFLAARAAQQRAGRHRPAADARVSQVVARHERALMRVALHWSLCRDDALDAYQRALEIYVRRIDSLDPATEINWLKVVVCRNLGTDGSASARRLRSRVPGSRPRRRQLHQPGNSTRAHSGVGGSVRARPRHCARRARRIRRARRPAAAA